MLVLTRKSNQSIRVGNEITINVVRIRGNTVQLGIQAPQNVHILRSELLEKSSSLPGEADDQAEPRQYPTDRAVQHLTIDLPLSLYAPEELLQETAAEPQFETPLQQFIFAP